MLSRRLIVRLSWLLAFTCFLSAAMPSQAIWRCDHAAQVLAAANLSQVGSGAMPCSSGRPTRLMDSGMKCCRSMHRTSPAVAGQSGMRVANPRCHPSVERINSAPSAVLPANVTASAPFPTVDLQLASAAFWGTSSPVFFSCRQRPPPRYGLASYLLNASPGLRAPPSA